MFDDQTIKAAREYAAKLDVPVSALLAVAEVESGGRLFSRVRGKNEPLIRFEGHYFDRLLTGNDRLEAREHGLAHPVAGRIKNPRSQVERWSLLNQAIRINRIAALSSVSWGLGQVMREHWRWLGYGSVDSMVATARSGAGGQLQLMVRYIEKAGLCHALNKRDWVAFARTYNGPSFHQNKYDTKMAAAFLRWHKKLGEAQLPQSIHDKVGGADDGRLMFGSRGARVAELQRRLTQAGYVTIADGLFGLVTDRIVRQFQRDHLLEETGIVGTREQSLLNDSGDSAPAQLDGLAVKLRASVLEQTHRLKRIVRQLGLAMRRAT